MGQFLKNRNNQLLIITGALLSVLLFRLASLTIVEGARYAEISENVRIKEIPVTAWRGEIYDRNGTLLAGNVPSFAVKLVISEMPSEELNKTVVALMEILEANGEDRIGFPVLLTETGEFEFRDDQTVEAWLESNRIEIGSDARTAFDVLRSREEIDEALSDYEAQNLLIYKGITPPISVRTMKFTAQMEKEAFLKAYGLEADLDAEAAYRAIRAYYEIPQLYDDRQTLDILAVRNALKEQGYRKYEPIILSSDLSERTAILIEEKGMHLPGIDVAIEPLRVYPKGALAAHVLGYLGKIGTSSEIEKYVEGLGYSRNDFIGKTGIEKSYETDLKGQDGSRKVEVDVYGRLIDEISEVRPVPGRDLTLTIDASLQETAEASLEKALDRIRTGSVYESPWGDYAFGEASPHADSGAAVAVDVNTGEILALANFPSYDPNLFASGISRADWDALQPENPRNPLAARPLYNIAALTAVQPGSTFKMITGLAALEQGLDPYRMLFSDGRIELPDRDFGCWIWNDYRARHGLTNLVKAIEVSCNYYFYNISVGRDHYREVPLDFEMDVDTMLSYARLFGLGEPTGIEIDEAAYGIPDPVKEVENKKYYLKLKLKSIAQDYFPAEIHEDADRLSQMIDTIANWAEENPSRGEIILRLKGLGVLEERVEGARFNKVEALADIIKYSYFNQIRWDVGDTFNLAIGQGGHTYTPLQMVRYVAALANGGTLYDLTLLKENRGKGQPIPLKDPSNLAYLREGMLRVTSGDAGTARTLFAQFPASVGAKTGTAQKQGKIPPPDEVAYLKNHLKAYNTYLKNRAAAGAYPGQLLELETLEREVEALVRSRNEELAAFELAGEADRITQKVREGYLDKGVIWRQVLTDLTGGVLGPDELDAYKEDYKSFAWFVAFAPYEDPQIAVAVLLFQGAHGGYAAPVAKDIIAEYLALDPPAAPEQELE